LSKKDLVDCIMNSVCDYIIKKTKKNNQKWYILCITFAKKIIFLLGLIFLAKFLAKFLARCNLNNDAKQYILNLAKKITSIFLCFSLTLPSIFKI
jgi:hypothetical protein